MNQVVAFPLPGSLYIASNKAQQALFLAAHLQHTHFPDQPCGLKLLAHGEANL